MMNNRRLTKNPTREEWLEVASAKLVPLFRDAGYELDLSKIRVSCGFPFGTRKAIGQAWSTYNSDDGTGEVFISPVMSDSTEVLAVLVHELVHQTVGLQCGHKAPFARCAKAVGLTGKMTATVASEELRGWFAENVLSKMPEYPHATLRPSTEKKKKTYLVKVECGDCGYTARVTQKWLDAVGAPICPCNDEPMVAAS